MSRICAPIGEARASATDLRAPWKITAYRPSILRKFPCVSFHEGRRVLGPLPELVVERVTAGVFYDLIGGGGDIRNEYGRRFELYAHNYIRAQLPNLNIISERKYKVGKQYIHSPDLLITEDGKIDVAFECKASRMSFVARFGNEAADARGYDDIVKAVFQLWRFFAHCRLGLTGYALTSCPAAIVLTLDSWLVMGGPTTKNVLKRAHEMADGSEVAITAQDRHPIVFCPIADLESVLAEADESSFRASLANAVTDEFDGWMLSNVHSKFAGTVERKPFPFDDLDTLIPWWGKLAAAKKATARVP